MDVIDQIDAQLLKSAAPETPVQYLVQWADPLKLACREFGIDTVREIACLLAQAGHESLGFADLEENLNYSAQRMAEVWPGRFAVNPKAKVKVPNAAAQRLHRQPIAIANTVYANRLGNGPPESGDGWRYRGYGLFQLTGRANQQAFGNAVGVPLDRVPDYLRTLEGAARSACWFFKVNGLEDLAKTPGVRDDTQRVNGGLIGLEDRTRRFNAVVDELLRRGA